MVNTVIEFLVSELCTYIAQRTGGDSNERPVAAINLVGQDGTPNDKAQDKLVVIVVNIAEDRVYHSVDKISRKPDGTGELIKPEAKINLHLLFVGNHSDYFESLKHISYVISFFQQRPAFDYAYIPGLNTGNGRVVLKLFSPTFEQQNHIWSVLGAKYVPSVMYQAGILNISDRLVEGEIPPVTDISANEV